MSACNAGDLGSIPGSGRSLIPEQEMATHSQFSCLENPMGRVTWWATVHGVAKGRTRLSDFTSSFIGEKFNYKLLITVFYRSK